jgi:hypothetical protein
MIRRYISIDKSEVNFTKMNLQNDHDDYHHKTFHI